MKKIFELLIFLAQSAKNISFSRLRLLLVVIAGILTGIASAGFIALINATLHATGDRSRLLWAFAALCLALPLFRLASTIMLLRFVQKATYDLRLELCRRILAAPLRHLETVGPARLQATITQDIGAIVTAVGAIPVLLIHLTVVVGCLSYLAWLSWQLLLVVFAFVALGLLTYQLPFAKAQRHFWLTREALNKLYGQLRGLTEGTKELKIHGERRRAFEAELLEPSAAAFQRHNVIGNTIHAFVNSWGQVLFFLVIGLLLFGASRFGAPGSETLTGFAMTILYMMTPLDYILNVMPTLSTAAVAARTVRDLGFSLAEEAPREAPADARPPAWSSLELCGVVHSYHTDGGDDRFSLGPLDLTFRAGELVFIVGGNGSGKTTLGKLLVGLYLPELGTLQLDGRPIREADLENYRQMFSVVFSDFYLFDRLLGLPGEGLTERGREYLARLALDHKLKIEGGRLSTLDLSQGQRKRLALLTSYLEDRPVYLFDEWAADQDPQFKNVFYYEILAELKSRGKTVFVITHDDRYFHLADRVIKLDYGKVELDGPVDALEPVIAHDRGAADSRAAGVLERR